MKEPKAAKCNMARKGLGKASKAESNSSTKVAVMGISRKKKAEVALKVAIVRKDIKIQKQPPSQAITCSMSKPAEEDLFPVTSATPERPVMLAAPVDVCSIQVDDITTSTPAPDHFVLPETTYAAPRSDVTPREAATFDSVYPAHFEATPPSMYMPLSDPTTVAANLPGPTMCNSLYPGQFVPEATSVPLLDSTTTATANLFPVSLQTHYSHASVHSDMQVPSRSLSHRYTEMDSFRNEAFGPGDHAIIGDTQANQVSDLSYLDYHTEAIFDSFLSTFGPLGNP